MLIIIIMNEVQITEKLYGEHFIPFSQLTAPPYLIKRPLNIKLNNQYQLGFLDKGLFTIYPLDESNINPDPLIQEQILCILKLYSFSTSF